MIKTKTLNFIDIQDLQLNQDFLDYLNNFDSSFMTEIIINDWFNKIIIYQENLNYFIQNNKSKFLEDLKKLNKYLIENKIDYLQII